MVPTLQVQMTTKKKTQLKDNIYAFLHIISYCVLQNRLHGQSSAHKNHYQKLNSNFYAHYAVEYQANMLTPSHIKFCET